MVIAADDRNACASSDDRDARGDGPTMAEVLFELNGAHHIS